MTSPNHDSLISELRALRHPGPAEAILDRISASWVRVPGPVGDLYVASTDHGIAYVRIGDAVHNDESEFRDQFRDRFGRPLRPADRPPAGLLPALHSQRAGKLRFDLRECGPLDQDVLLAVLSIPRGQVRPYAWIAHQIGRPAAVRAVGSALGRNPVPVLIPCHRVVRSDGTVGEYVFGAPTKRALLDAEGANITEMTELARHGVHYLASDTTGVVCFPTCSNARRITEAHRHGFRSMRLAEQAGYRACRHCRPVPVEAD
jgi:O-6-methylguanine DNA methyltransferase